MPDPSPSTAGPSEPPDSRPATSDLPAEAGEGSTPHELELPFNSSGVCQSLFGLVGPRESGKSEMAAILASMCSPRERLIVAGPVPTIAEKLSVPWHKVSTLDKKGASAFFGGLERSDAHFFLVLDEADSFLGAAGYYNRELQEWVRDNRNFGQGGIFVAHSVGEVPKSYLNNCDVIFFFRSSVPGVRDWLRKYARSDMPDIDEVVSHLGQYQALVWAPKSEPKCLGIAKANLEDRTIEIVDLETLREPPKEPVKEEEDGARPPPPQGPG
jgi:hypothetical protein